MLMVMPPFGSDASVCLANGLPNLGFRAYEGLAVEALHATALEIEETLSQGLWMSMFTNLLQMWLSFLIRLLVEILIKCSGMFTLSIMPMHGCGSSWLLDWDEMEGFHRVSTQYDVHCCPSSSLVLIPRGAKWGPVVCR